MDEHPADSTKTRTQVNRLVTRLRVCIRIALPASINSRMSRFATTSMIAQGFKRDQN